MRSRSRISTSDTGAFSTYAEGPLLIVAGLPATTLAQSAPKSFNGLDAYVEGRYGKAPLSTLRAFVR